MVTHSRILAWIIPWTEEPGGPQSMGLQKAGHKWVTNTFTFHMYSVSSVEQSYPTLCDPMDWRNRFPCPSPTPGDYPNSCPSHRWCHPTISSSVMPFTSHFQSFPESGSFPVSQFFTSGGQSIGVSASASVLTMNFQDWFPLGLTGWVSSQSRDSQKSSPTPQFRSINSLVLSFLYGPILKSIHDYW